MLFNNTLVKFCNSTNGRTIHTVEETSMDCDLSLNASKYQFKERALQVGGQACLTCDSVTEVMDFAEGIPADCDLGPYVSGDFKDLTKETFFSEIREQACSVLKEKETEISGFVSLSVLLIFAVCGALVFIHTYYDRMQSNRPSSFESVLNTNRRLCSTDIQEATLELIYRETHL